MAEFKDFEKLGELNDNNIDRAKEILSDMQRDAAYKNSKDEYYNNNLSKQHEERQKERDKEYEKEGEAKGSIRFFRWTNHMIHAVTDPFEKLLTDTANKLPLIGPLLGRFLEGLFKLVHFAIGAVFRLASLPFQGIQALYQHRSRKSKHDEQYQREKNIRDADQKIKEFEEKQKTAEKENEKAREAGGDNVFRDEKDGPLAGAKNDGPQADTKNVEKTEPKLRQHANLEDRTTIFKKGPKDVYGADQPQQPAMNELKARIEKADNQGEMLQARMRDEPTKRPGSKTLNFIGKLMAAKILDAQMKEDRWENDNKPGQIERRIRRVNPQIKGSKEAMEREMATLEKTVVDMLKDKNNSEIADLMDSLSSGKRTRQADDFRKEVLKTAKNSRDREKNEEALGLQKDAPAIGKSRDRSKSLRSPAKGPQLPNM